MQKEHEKELFNKVMAKVHQEEHLNLLKKRVAFFSFLALCGIVAFVPAFGALQTAFSQSGFAQFVSLIFIDPAMTIAHWNEFLLSILESFPTISIAEVFAALFLFLGSMRMLALDINTASSLAL